MNRILNKSVRSFLAVIPGFLNQESFLNISMTQKKRCNVKKGKYCYWILYNREDEEILRMIITQLQIFE